MNDVRAASSAAIKIEAPSGEEPPCFETVQSVTRFEQSKQEVFRFSASTESGTVLCSIPGENSNDPRIMSKPIAKNGVHFPPRKHFPAQF